MADRAGLKFVGFIFATVTLVVMLTTAMVWKAMPTAAIRWKARGSRAGNSGFV